MDPLAVTITLATTLPTGILFSTTSGEVSVAAGTPEGTYTFDYTICENLNPTNCDTATVTVTVEAALIDAVEDLSAPVNGFTGGVAIPNVLTNDTLNGVVVDPLAVTITLATTLPTGIIFSTTSGEVSVAAGTPPGTYTFEYTICEILNPANCDTATVTIFVPDPSVQLLKEGTWVDNNGDGIVSLGDTIEYLFSVVNTGDIELNTILVTDVSLSVPLVVSAVVPDVLPPGQTGTASATYTITQDDINAGVVYNVAFVDAFDTTGQEVSDESEDPTPVLPGSPLYNPACPECTTVELEQKLGIALIKTGVFNNENGDDYAQVGETITYNFTVTNTGNVTLFNITVSDPLPGLVLTGGPITLLPGESNSTAFVATYTITAEDIVRGFVTNQATVRGATLLDEVADDLSDSDSNLGNNPTLIIIFGCQVEVFNAISANNDGRNEILYIRGLDCFTDNNVTVYNRWGVVVYEVDGYNNEDKSFRGYSEGRVTVNKNEKLPDGTYYYVLRYKDLSGNAIEKVGYLYISNN